jgi:hypothetical protein
MAKNYVELLFKNINLLIVVDDDNTQAMRMRSYRRPRVLAGISGDARANTLGGMCYRKISNRQFPIAPPTQSRLFVLWGCQGTYDT